MPAVSRASSAAERVSFGARLISPTRINGGKKDCAADKYLELKLSFDPLGAGDEGRIGETSFIKILLQEVEDILQPSSIIWQHQFLLSLDVKCIYFQFEQFLGAANDRLRRNFVQDLGV